MIAGIKKRGRFWAGTEMINKDFKKKKNFFNQWEAEVLNCNVTHSL
jgi:hypothetical protein